MILTEEYRAAEQKLLQELSNVKSKLDLAINSLEQFERRAAVKQDMTIYFESPHDDRRNSFTITKFDVDDDKKRYNDTVDMLRSILVQDVSAWRAEFLQVIEAWTDFVEEGNDWQPQPRSKHDPGDDHK